MTREEELGIIIDGIENLDNVAMETARKKWNSIAKPLHSLGKLKSILSGLPELLEMPR